MKAMGGRTIPLISKIFFFRLIRPKIFDQWKKAPENYDPKPNYEIPKYEEWMKIPDFDKDELYLRPTQGCKCKAPEIVALAYKLGVDKLLAEEQISSDLAQRQFEWGYAENALK